MSKYDEIMNRIVVTEEMQQRILSHLNSSAVPTSSGKPPRFISSYQKQFCIAACFALLLLTAFLVNQNFWRASPSDPATSSPESESESSLSEDAPVGNEQMAAASYGIVSFDDAASLSEALGFSVEDLPFLPFDVDQVTYASYFNEFAEINYSGPEQSLCYRIAKGSEDVSGDYNEYSQEKHITINNRDILLKGNSNQYLLVTWTDDSYSYSLSFEQAVTEEDITAILSAF